MAAVVGRGFGVCASFGRRFPGSSRADLGASGPDSGRPMRTEDAEDLCIALIVLGPGGASLGLFLPASPALRGPLLQAFDADD